jgi:hypothetical protein
MSSVVASCFLLEDPRLTMPEIKAAAMTALPRPVPSPHVGALRGATPALLPRGPVTGGAAATHGVAGAPKPAAPVQSPNQAAAAARGANASIQHGVEANAAEQFGKAKALMPEAPRKNPALPSAPGGILSNLGRMGTGQIAMGLGSAGALKGWLDPGTETDEYGHTHQKSRLGAALSGATVGAGAGLLGGRMIRGGANLAQQHMGEPKAAAVEEKEAGLNTQVVAPGFRSGVRQSPAGGAPQGGVGVKAASECEPCKEVDPKLNKHSSEPLPYKVPSLQLKK